MKTLISPRSRGFTIIEILLAMAILGMIVAAIYSSWMTIVRGAQTGQRVAAAAQRSRIAVRTLVDGLLCARSFASNPQYYGFVAENGEEAKLSFVAKLPESFPRGGRFGSFDVRRLDFSLESGPDSDRQLVLRQTPMLMEMDIDEKEHPIVLEKNVKSFELEFWDVRTADWIDEWTETNQLPPKVRVTLQLGVGDPRTSRVVRGFTNVITLPVMTVPPIAGMQPPGHP